MTKKYMLFYDFEKFMNIDFKIFEEYTQGQLHIIFESEVMSRCHQ